MCPNTTLERSLEQESSLECACSKDLFNNIYIGGKIGSFLLLALWALRFKTLQNSYSQSNFHLGMLGTHLFCSLPHMWECVWVPRHFPNPLSLSWTFSLGHGPFSLGSNLILFILEGHCVSFPRVGHALKLGRQHCPMVKKKGQYLHCHYEVQFWTPIFHALWLRFLWHFSYQATLTKFFTKLNDHFEPMLQTQNKGCNCQLGFSLCLVIESHQRGGGGGGGGCPFY